MKRKSKWILVESLIVISVLLFLSYMMFPLFLKVQNINTPENFPDPNFRQAVEAVMGVEPGGRFSASDARKKEGTLSVRFPWETAHYSQKPPIYITNIEGIRFFENITELDCGGQHIQEIDLSRNPKLEVLNVTGNPLQELDLTHNPLLRELYCNANPFTELDLSKNKHLTRIDCSSTKLTHLDVTANQELEFLHCSQIGLARLDVSANSKLRWLICDRNQISELDLSRNPSLQQLIAYSNQLEKLNISQNLLLEHLNLNNNRLREFPNLSEYVYLYAVGVEENHLDCDDLEKILSIKDRFKYPFSRLKDTINHGIFYEDQKECDLSECSQ